MKNRAVRLCVLAALAAAAVSCAGPAKCPCGKACAQGKPAIVFSIVSGPEDPHAVTTAMQLAGHALDEGCSVVLFFNVKGVQISVTSLDAELAFKDQPIAALLADLLKRGATALVCPHCIKAMGVDAADLVRGAGVATAESLFSALGPNTVVFTH